MQTRQIYAMTIATAALISSSIAIAVSEFSEPWMIFIFPFLALLTGGLTGWYIPAWLMVRFGETRLWATLSGMACACLSMMLCAASYVLFVAAFAPGFSFHSEGILLVMLFCITVTQIACGLFAYPLGALAGYVALTLSQNEKAAADTATASE